LGGGTKRMTRKRRKPPPLRGGVRCFWGGGGERKLSLGKGKGKKKLRKSSAFEKSLLNIAIASWENVWEKRTELKPGHPSKRVRA